MAETETKQSPKVAAVRFTGVGKLYYFDYAGFPDLQIGDYVIVDTARGRYMGEVIRFVAIAGVEQEYRPILRLATPRDMLLNQQWKDKENEALLTCQEKARVLGGFEEVKFCAAQYNYDGTSLIFLFTAEQKVDVSQLWGELKHTFSAQVEMRQVGPRDVAKLYGGHGACGELRCCSAFLTDFGPISIKMAKIQGISLNPAEITGMCGRLRCCLVYEYEQYVEATKQLPRCNKRIGTPLGPGKVIAVHPLQDTITVLIGEEGVHLFRREELIPLEESEALSRKADEPHEYFSQIPAQTQKMPDEGTAKAEGLNSGEDSSGQRRRDARPRDRRRGQRRRGQKKQSRE